MNHSFDHKRAAVLNLGCKVNHYETEAIRQQLIQAGFEMVSFKSPADVYVINTCTVTGEAARKSRQMVSRAKQKNPHALVVAVGCDVEFEGNRVDADLAIGNVGKSSVVAQILDTLVHRSSDPAIFKMSDASAKEIQTDEDLAIADVNEQGEFEEFGAVIEQVDTRAIVKVQDGCNQFCTYCAIPYARGRVRSRDPKAVIEEVRALVQHGFKEIVLTGIHVCSYGLDWKRPGEHLMDLCDALKEIEGLVRIRFGSIEPKSVTESFAQRMSQNEKMCHHIHLSLQSGSDAILRLMHRRYTASEYEACVSRLRHYMPDITLTTDVIVGFPGETVAQHEESLNFCQRIGFHKIHVFKYSPRAGTVAARLPYPVSSSEQDRRSKAFIKMATQMGDALMEQAIGTHQQVILEQPKTLPDGRLYWSGYTSGYLPVAMLTPGTFETGQVLDVELIDAQDGLLYAQCMAD